MGYINGEDKLVKITKSKLIRLLNAEMELEALQCGGVDNWTWYSDSFHDYIEGYLEDNGLTRDEVGDDFCIYDIAKKEAETYEEV